MRNDQRQKIEQDLFHGTTVTRAQVIVSSMRLSPHERLYVVFKSNRDLAEVFARRRAANESDRPAIVKIVVASEDFERLRKRGDASLIPFDAGDAQYLRLRNQWVISSNGVQVLNARLLAVEMEMIA